MTMLPNLREQINIGEIWIRNFSTAIYRDLAEIYLNNMG